MHCFRTHAHSGQELTLRRACFITVFLRVEIQRRLNPGMTQNALHGFGFDFCLVHEPVAKRVTKVVKSEPLAVLDLHSGRLRCRPEMIGNECGRG